MIDEKLGEEIKETVSRRSFLTKAGAMTAGVALAGSLLGSAFKEDAEAAVTLPIPYKKLDIAKVRKRAYDAYFVGGCCYGAAVGLLATLREVSGTNNAWYQIPEDMFKYGAGGIAGWGTLCGALNGSMFVINLATPRFTDVGNELFKWYTKNPFPSTRLDVYEPAAYKRQKTTIAHSPLCHVSVSTWCEKTGFGVNSDAKKHRCAKLTADTAAKAAEILNKLLSLKVPFKPAEKFVAGTNFCMTCHAFGNVNPKTVTNSVYGNMDNEQGKMDCNECHDNEHPHKTVFKKNGCKSCH